MFSQYFQAVAEVRPRFSPDAVNFSRSYGAVGVAFRKPPNKQYRISAFRRIQPKATHGPSQPFGTSDIQGIAKGMRRRPDSPESAGFFEATKNTQAKTAAADNRNNPAASTPPSENLNAGVIVPPNRWVRHQRSGESIESDPIDL